MTPSSTSPSGRPAAAPTRPDRPDPYLSFDRDSWSALAATTPLPLTAADIERIRALGDEFDLTEADIIYRPLSRLLHLHVGAARRLRRDRARFLGVQGRRTPFVIGIGGSVAVGKSTTARLLTELMRRWSDTPRVALVPTDGFLYPNAELERLGLMDRKGFPESYDRAALLRFVSDIKSGLPEVSAPVYSHVTYDIVPGRRVLVDRPDIVIIEGLNVLQPAGSARKADDVAGPPRRLGEPPQAVAPRPTGGRQSGSPRGEQRTTGVPSPPSGTPNRLPDLMVSDFFDFSIYLDAPVPLIRRWYVERFLELRETAFGKPGAYFHRYQDLSDAEAVRVAGDIWERINEPNLVDNIEPTRSRATLILQKGPDHKVTQVKLRRL